MSKQVFSVIDVVSVVNVVLVFVNIFLMYRNFIMEKKRKFEDTLFDTKFKSYQLTLEKVYNISSQLDYASEPFSSIHKIKDAQEWEKHCENEIFPLLPLGMNLSEDISKDYGLIYPDKILAILKDIAMYATRMVVVSIHFNGEYIIEKQGLMNEKIFELLNEMRKDLGIEKIDKGLKKRLNEKL